jgi:hypothetical protein
MFTVIENLSTWPIEKIFFERNITLADEKVKLEFF